MKRSSFIKSLVGSFIFTPIILKAKNKKLVEPTNFYKGKYENKDAWILPKGKYILNKPLNDYFPEGAKVFIEECYFEQNISLEYMVRNDSERIHLISKCTFQCNL